MNADDAHWDYKPDGRTKSEQPALGGNSNTIAKKTRPSNSDAVVEWTASEYIEHNRGAGWYGILLVATALVTAIVYWFTKDIFASVVTVLVGLAVVIFTVHKPKETRYELSAAGLTIGEKNYPYSSFKSFAIVREGGLNSIIIVPVKRFLPPITIYFAPNDEQQIIDVLGQHLPYEETSLDMVDRITRRLRF